MSEQEIERKIQEKGLNAPRLTPDLIESVIVSEHYFTGKEGELGSYKMNDDIRVGGAPTDKSNAALSCLTFCVLVLDNGFSVTGESACASPENFDAEIGREIARDNAKSKVWALEGYLLKQKLHNQE